MKTITLFRKMALMAGLMLLALSGWGQYFVNFEGSGETKTAYASGTVTLSGLQWDMTEALIGTDAADWKNGARSTRMRGYGASVMTMLADKPNGIGSISFYYRRYGSDAQVDWKVEYSDNGGSSWIQIGSSFTAPASDVVQTFSETLNITGNVRIRIKRATESGTSNRRMNIDDITITDYYGGTPVVAAPTFNPPGGTYYTPQNVVISTSTEESDVYYSFTGDDGPWTYFTEPVGVATNTTIWAYAFKIGWDPSPVVQAVYTFPPVVEVADIASLRAYASTKTSDVYKLTGEAVLTFKTGSRNAKYIQDATGAILIDDPNGKITTSYNLYDGISGITGTLGFYENMLQFTPVMNPGVATSSGNTINPAEITLAQLTTDYQAKLVKIGGVTVNGTGNFAASTNYTINDNSKATGVLRTAYSDLNYIGQPIPSVPQDITAVVLQYQSTMQIVPRSSDDFENTVFDVDPPANFAATALSSDEIEVTFTPNNASNEVVIVHNKSGIFNEPTGTPPALDSDFAGGTLLYVGTASPQIHDGLNPSETIYYKAWSYDGSNYSAGLTTNATTFASEPTNHASDFTATANTHNSITVAWTDSDATAYLVIGSSVGYEEITAPTDGAPVADGTLVKNITSAKGNHEFTGLTPETGYFFKIFPYNGSGATINYKTDGEVPQASATTLPAPPEPEVFTKWDFEADPLLPNVTNPAPSLGNGVASTIGSMGTLSRGNGSLTGCSQVTGTGAWAFGSVSPGTNESSGAQFMVPTSGFENIVFEYDQRFSNTSTRTVRIQYTLNGTTWLNFDVSSANYVSGCANRGGIDLGRIDIGDPAGTNVSDGWSRRTIDFSGIPGANNNSNFGIRIVAAHYAETGQFRQANNVTSVATTGTWRFDNVTFSGLPFVPDPPVKLVITDVNSGIAPTVDVPFSVTIQAKDANNIPANVTTDTQIMLMLGNGTGTLGGTVTGTIAAGQSTLVLNDVTYNTPENGVVIIAMTIGGMNLTLGVSSPFNVISPATHLAFVGLPPYGYINQPVTQFTVEARRPNNTVDPGYTGTVNLSLAGKSVPGGTVSGTLSVAAIEGIATFNNVFFDESGTYTLNADAEGLAQAASGAIEILPEPVISSVLLPEFMNADSPSNNRLPYAFRANMDNLIPNSTYKFINQAIISTDGATTGGAGNCIFVIQDGSFYRSTSPSFTSAANHGEFTTDANGSYTGWFILEATTNARFTPGNEVFMRIRINDGAGGTSVKHYLTIPESVTMLGFGIEAELNKGTAVRGISTFSPKNFVFLYDEALEIKGRPMAGTSIESVGINFAGITQYAAFYKSNVSGVDGAWGTIIPNINANGVRLIEERSLADGGVIDNVQSFDGIWGETNTVNPSGGATALVIDLMPPVIPPTLTLHNIIVSPSDPDCYAATDLITVSDFIVNTGISVTLVVGPNGAIRLLEGTRVIEEGYLRAWIDVFENYCSLPEATVAAKNETAAFVATEMAEPVSLFRAYPNPTTGIFALELNQVEAGMPATLEIYNLMGNRLMQKEISGTSLWNIDLTALPRGMYIVRVLNNGQAETQRIIRM